MDLCNRNDIQALLQRHGFHFSKAMGQNFLIQGWVPRDIAAACGADGVIVEVHNDPIHALCDGAQSLTCEQFAEVAEKVRAVREAVTR